MADPLVIRLDDQTRRRVDRLIASSGRSAFYAGLDRVLSRHASLVAGHVSRTALSGQVLKRRTGALARSVVGEAVRQAGVPGIRVGVLRGPALKYAAVHEHGKTIRPRSARALAFPPPGSPALTPAGVDRYGGPRNYPEPLVFIPFHGKKLIGGLYPLSALRAAGPGPVSLRALKAAYLLAKEVKIPARRWLSRGVEERLPAVAAAVARFVGGLISGRTS